MKKSYEVLCTILLILIIGLCLLQITGVSASFHERLDEQKNHLDNSRIAMSYYLTKFRHFDTAEGIEIKDNRVFIHEYGVVTCIFVEDGVLYESTVVEGLPHTKDYAFEITKVDDVRLEQHGKTVAVIVTNDGETRTVHYGFSAYGGNE